MPNAWSEHQPGRVRKSVPGATASASRRCPGGCTKNACCAPGGVLVSASRKDGAVGPVTLRAAAGAAPVRLASPWPGAACELVREDGTVKRLKPAAVLEIRVPKGGSVVLRAL